MRISSNITKTKDLPVPIYFDIITIRGGNMREYVHYQIVLLLVALLAEPVNGLAYEISQASSKHALCSYNVDNSESVNFSVHCNHCTFFNDVDDTNWYNIPY